MISIDQAMRVHTIAIKKFGGADGVRDTGALESGLERPFQTFDGTDLYPTVFEKAAAIGESIIMNLPFVDGNKRTGYLLLEAILRNEIYKISSPDNDLYNFVINISTGSLSFDGIVEWLKANTKV
ncbi:MAG: type II toxin-antitoxin system death-on-curing family toxin [Chitinophagaceae bacterium]|nr:type II toxin-antitoxin system death-on-curing family toxin [Chitinophagaceae bacterium]